jgi:hypothetical protein
MFNRLGPPNKAREMISALRLESFRSDQGGGHHTGLPRLTQSSETKAHAAIQASRFLQRTYPPPLAVQRGPVQDEGGNLDPLDRAAMDAVEGRIPGVEIESSIPPIYPEAGDELMSPRSKRYTC